MKKCLLCVLILCFVSCPKTIYGAQEELDQESLQGVESVLEEQDSDISFTQIVKKLMTGNIKEALGYLWEKLSGDFFSSFVCRGRGKQKDRSKEDFTPALVRITGLEPARLPAGT